MTFIFLNTTFVTACFQHMNGGLTNCFIMFSINKFIRSPINQPKIDFMVTKLQFLLRVTSPVTNCKCKSASIRISIFASLAKLKFANGKFQIKWFFTTQLKFCCLIPEYIFGTHKAVLFNSDFFSSATNIFPVYCNIFVLLVIFVLLSAEDSRMLFVFFIDAAHKMFSIKDFFSKCDHFLCSVV